MIKKTLTYESLDGDPITEDFYFHLSTAEIAKMELTTEGGYASLLQNLVNANNGKQIIEQFDAILKAGYGVRSDDGKRFIKNDQVWAEFYESDAYNVLFMQLISDPDASSQFVRGMLPANFEQEVARIQANKPQDAPVQQNAFETQVPQPSTALPYSAADIMSLTPEQFAELQAKQSQK